MKVLFICGRNRRRSPTAEVVIGRMDGVETDSAGVRDDADVVVNREQIEWADVIVLMEQQYRKPLVNRVGSACLRDKRIVSVDIKDIWEPMDEGLVAVLLARVPRMLGLG